MSEILTIGNIAVTLFVIGYLFKIENRLTRIETLLNERRNEDGKRGLHQT